MKVLADENVPWPLVRLLRSMGLDIIWIPETGFRGINDRDVIKLANKQERVILTRDRDFLELALRRRVRCGLIHIGESVRRDNVEKLVKNIAKALEIIKEKPSLVVVTSISIELYPLTP